MDAVHAAEEFHWGVKAFHNSLYNEAIRAFERSLAFTPHDTRVAEWLGRAYLQSGYEDTALSIIEGLIDSDAGTPLLQDLVDTIRARQGLQMELAEETRYVPAFTLTGVRDEHTLFSRPASLFARGDGSYYLTSFAGNQVLRINANGSIRQRFLGGLQGLDHPFDVLEVDGYVFVTEFLGNSVYRSTIDGTGGVRFGNKGTGEGDLIGPQYLAADRGHLYVTETGNRRVSKFDYEGNFILSFGQRSAAYPGMKSPTGIYVHQGLVYVADGQEKKISVFDQSGNFLYTVGEDVLIGPEGISVYDDDTLVVADTRRVLAFDIETEHFRVLADLGGEANRITKAVRDINGGIAVADFNRNTVTMLTDMSNLYTSLSVQFQRVLSDDFPTVYLELTVEDRMGNPYVGLDESNFVISEFWRRVQDDSFLRPVEVERPFISVLLDRSSAMMENRQGIRKAAEEVYTATESVGARLNLVSAGELPAKEGARTLGLQQFSLTSADAGTYTDDWRFSLGLRLAVSEVIAWPGPRAVILITEGSPGDLGFEDYGLEIAASHMRNNGVAFYCIYTRPDPVRPDEFEYLVEFTGGKSAYLYQSEGLTPLLEHIYRRHSGRYFFSYESVSDTNFGDQYLPIQAEVLHFKRSGRTESGYFAPRE
jgi:DNA-binding beta-propeller fold protein YncE